MSIWMEPGREAKIEQVARQPDRFALSSTNTQHHLDHGKTLWVKLALHRPQGSEMAWTLNTPLPFADSVVLYQKNPTSGNWSSQVSGDQIAQSDWTKHSLYPEFDLYLPAGEVQTVFLQVRNFNTVNLPIRLAPSRQRDIQRLGELLVLGMILGSLFSMTVLSFVRFVEHRNRSDLLACAYGLAIGLTVASINGVTGALVWSEILPWADYANTALPPVTMGLALLFLRDLYAVSSRHRRFDTALVVTAWCTMASTLSLAVLERANAHAAITAITFFAAMMGIIGSLFSWRFRSTIGRLLFVSYALQFMAMTRLIAESWGWVPISWELRYLTSFAIALSVPLMLYALSHATHDRKELAVRANHLPNQDALTGLLTRASFMEQYEAAYQRVISDGEPVAVVLVSVINHEHIRQTMGDTAAEQCLLRAVVKLQRVLRDIDPAGRIDTARFALLLEGVSDKDSLNRRLVKLIASGLTPIPGLKPEVTLQFRAACVLLHHNPVDSEHILGELEGLLQDMSPRTRRPIRFLEAASTRPSEQPDPSH